jgi:multiple sugar transport system permease protein
MKPALLPPRGLSDRAVRNWCIFPVLFLLVAFNIFPLIVSLYISFHHYIPTEQTPLTQSPFVGLDNYRKNLDEPDTKQEPWKTFQRTSALVVVTVGLQTVIGFSLAMLLNRKIPGRGIFVALLLIPMTMSPAVVAQFWKYMFLPDGGIINYILGHPYHWDLSNPLAFWAVVIVEVWIWTPFMMLLSLAGLNSIPKHLYEAAQVDRASAWFRFRRITLPLVMPMLLLGIVFRAMDTFRIFDTAYVLNKAKIGQDTTFVSVSLFDKGIAKGSENLGNATAMAYLLLFVAIALGNIAVHYLDKMRSRQS